MNRRRAGRAKLTSKGRGSIAARPGSNYRGGEGGASSVVVVASLHTFPSRGEESARAIRRIVCISREMVSARVYAVPSFFITRGGCV